MFILPSHCNKRQFLCHVITSPIRETSPLSSWTLILILKPLSAFSFPSLCTLNTFLILKGTNLIRQREPFNQTEGWAIIHLLQQRKFNWKYQFRQTEEELGMLETWHQTQTTYSMLMSSVSWLCCMKMTEEYVAYISTYMKQYPSSQRGRERFVQSRKNQCDRFQKTLKDLLPRQLQFSYCSTVQVHINQRLCMQPINQLISKKNVTSYCCYRDIIKMLEELGLAPPMFEMLMEVIPLPQFGTCLDQCWTRN